MMKRWRKPKRKGFLSESLDGTISSNSRHKKTHIILYRAGGGVLAQYPLHSYPLPEATILSLSVQYFDDPEPCHIHRSAVLARAMEELASLCPEGEAVPIGTLPAQQQAYFAEGEAEAFAIGAEA